MKASLDNKLFIELKLNIKPRSVPHNIAERPRIGVRQTNPRSDYNFCCFLIKPECFIYIEYYSREKQGMGFRTRKGMRLCWREVARNSSRWCFEEGCAVLITHLITGNNPVLKNVLEQLNVPI